MNPAGQLNLDCIAIDIMEYMETKGLSQTGFSDKSGISKSTVSRLVAKIGTPDIDVIVMICETLHVPIARYMKNMPETITVEGGDTMANIKALLDQDPKLTDDSKKSLFELMQMTYTQFRRLKHV